MGERGIGETNEEDPIGSPFAIIKPLDHMTPARTPMRKDEDVLLEEELELEDGGDDPPEW